MTDVQMYSALLYEVTRNGAVKDSEPIAFAFHHLPRIGEKVVADAWRVNAMFEVKDVIHIVSNSPGGDQHIVLRVLWLNDID